MGVPEAFSLCTGHYACRDAWLPCSDNDHSNNEKVLLALLSLLMCSYDHHGDGPDANREARATSGRTPIWH